MGKGAGTEKLPAASPPLREKKRKWAREGTEKKKRYCRLHLRTCENNPMNGETRCVSRGRTHSQTHNASRGRTHSQRVSPFIRFFRINFPDESGKIPGTEAHTMLAMLSCPGTEGTMALRERERWRAREKERGRARAREGGIERARERKRESARARERARAREG